MKINWLFFRGCFVLFCVLNAFWVGAQGGGNHNISVPPSIGPGTLPTSLEVLVRYNPDLYEDYKLEITFPQEFYNSFITGGNEDVRLHVVQRDASNRKVIFEIEFLVVSDKDWPEINIPIRGFSRPASSCESYQDTINYTVSAKEKANETPVNFSTQTSVQLNATGVSTERPSVSISAFNQGSESLPVFYDISLSNINIIDTLQTTIYFNSGELEFITAVNTTTGVNATHGIHHTDVIAMTTMGDSLRFRFKVNSTPYAFRVYFKPKVNLISEPVKVDIRESAHGKNITDTTGCKITIRQNSRTDIPNRSIEYALDEISFQPNLSLPNFQNISLVCANACAPSVANVIFEINGHYMTDSTTRDLEIRPHSSAKVSSLQLYNHFAGQLGSIQLEYKVCGAEEPVNTILSGQTFNFESGGVYLEYLYIKNIPIDAGTGRDIRLNYSHTTTASSCGDVNKFYYGFAGATLSERLMSSPSSCNPSKQISDGYYTMNTPSSMTSNNTFDAEEDALVLIRLRITSTNLPGTYVFEDISYTLSDKMYFTGEPLLFSYNAVYSNFKSAGDFMDGNLFVSDLTVRIDPENNEKMLIENVTIDKSCTNGINDLYILARVRTKAKIPMTYNNQGYRSTVQKNDTQLSVSTLTLWYTVVGSFQFSVDTKLACSHVMLHEDSEVRPGDALTLYYIMGNSGSDKMQNLHYQIFSLQSDDLSIAPELTGVLYKVDENNTFEELNNSYPIQLNTETVITGELLGYHQFIVAVRYKMPVASAFLDKTFEAKMSGYGYSMGGSITSNHKDSIYITVRKEAPFICAPASCSECVTSFSPLSGEEYQLSAWIREDYRDIVPATYRHSGVRIIFDEDPATAVIYRPAGPIIDGWQRVDTTFAIPLGAGNISIGLVNEKAEGDVYFDDIRIHPFRSNMKSFVYDPSTQRLVAELDENNYATRYEYDDEGILIRVKKETERGVMTIKETRTNQSKIHAD